MSENEKRLREWLALGTRAAEADVTGALDALLAEHRAEVEGLEACIEEWKDASGLLVGEDPDGVTPKMLRDDLAQRERELSSARDAALEEAATWLQGGHNPPCYERPISNETTVGECGNCARARGIRALKSCPAEVAPVIPPCPGCGEEPAGLCFGCETIRTMTGGDPEEMVPVAKVREEARRMLVSRNLAKDPIGTVHAMLEALGIDLDASPERGEEARAKAEDVGHGCHECWDMLHRPTSGVCKCACSQCVTYRNNLAVSP